jgi:hypothetical protein
MSKHPMQEIILDDKGVPRFRANRIVKFLHDHGGFDMSVVRGMGWTQEEWSQFLQLIGFSVCCYGEFQDVDRQSVDEADEIAKDLVTAAKLNGTFPARNEDG